MLKVEFGTGDKVHYHDGKKMVKTVVIKATINPVDNVVEYQTSRYSQRKGGKRAVIRKLLLAKDIKESQFYEGPEYDTGVL